MVAARANCPGMSSTHTLTTAWACVLVRPQRRIAPRSMPGWKNSPGNRPDPRRHKSYLLAEPRDGTGGVPDPIDLQYRAAIQVEGCDDESIGQRNSSTPFESVRGDDSPGAGFAARSVPL